jgi:predicted nucleotide-binding protein
MAEQRCNVSESNPNEPKRVRLSQTDVPSMELERALRLARTIWDQFAGRPARPLQLAEALEIKPSSGGWRELTGASIAYGLTEGGYNAQEIRLTELGRRIVAPRREGDDLVATVESSISPRVCREFLTRYDGSKFPLDKIAASVLVDLGVPKERTEKVVAIIRANGQFSSVFRSIKGENYVALGAGPSSVKRDTNEEPEPNQDGAEDLLDPTTASTPDASSGQTGTELQSDAPARPRKIFVAHGRKHEALDAIKKALDRLKVPYVVALDEPHAGRPISSKVAELMKECAAGIFIFTPDETFTSDSGEKIHRPSENVIYELGAGSVLWGGKIVILKEESVYFPSDYRDLGYVSFSMGNLASVQSNLLMELIGLDFVRLQVG